MAKALSTFGAEPYSPANIGRSMLPNAGRLGDSAAAHSVDGEAPGSLRPARLAIEKSDQSAPNQSAKLDHRAEHSPDSPPRANRIGFATMTREASP